MREQLVAANQRAQALEKSVQERDGEGARLRVRIETLEVKATEARAKFDAASAAHQAERARLEERQAVAESHWLREVDRARQTTKEAAKEHQNQVKELRRRVDAVQEERDELNQNLLEARADLKTAAAVREQLEERLYATQQAAMASRGDLHRKHSRRAKRRQRTRGG